MTCDETNCGTCDGETCVISALRSDLAREQSMARPMREMFRALLRHAATEAVRRAGVNGSELAPKWIAGAVEHAVAVADATTDEEVEAFRAGVEHERDTLRADLARVTAERDAFNVAAVEGIELGQRLAAAGEHAQKVADMAREALARAVSERDTLCSEVRAIAEALRMPGAAGADVARAAAAVLATSDAIQADLRIAAGECRVAAPEPGSDLSRVLVANRLLRTEVERLTFERDEAVEEVNGADGARADAIVDRDVARAEVERLRERATAAEADKTRLHGIVERYLREHDEAADRDTGNVPPCNCRFCTDARSALATPPPAEAPQPNSELQSSEAEGERCSACHAEKGFCPGCGPESEDEPPQSSASGEARTCGNCDHRDDDECDLLGESIRDCDGLTLSCGGWRAREGGEVQR